MAILLPKGPQQINWCLCLSNSYYISNDGSDESSSGSDRSDQALIDNGIEIIYTSPTRLNVIQGEFSKQIKITDTDKIIFRSLNFLI